MIPVDLRLYGIIDPDRTAGRDPVELVRQVVAGGATLIQYRDKRADGRRQVELARALKEALRKTGVPLVINDRVDIALAAGADGVHLGQDDMHPTDARSLLGVNAIIGLTIKTPEQADALVRMPVDYGCIGGVFSTVSKHNPSAPIGLDGLAEAAARAKAAAGAPVGAIAGIDASNAEAVIAAGADGIAVISALFMAPHPRAEAQRLRNVVDRSLASRSIRS
ncbi:thiamine phosphate synthase [Microvirga makkahensis]|uniref:Thiamine-phosphate synthase n=1 Tax=Microvirga makkahensis TaxID=1128670 RepID=A0A7X3MPM0_9HYPH|nr:thiamine phosphate synthase [Microvirga makkahensis]MXQ10845.1 thiamine phosphate synthase [Microvirga makkahensis]